MGPQGEPPRGSVGQGVLIGLANAVGSAIVLAVVGGILGSSGLAAGYALAAVAGFGFGLAQIPGVVFFARTYKDSKATVQGLIVTASILFLLNAGCWGLIMTSSMNFH